MITQEYVRNILDYVDGELFWKTNKSHFVKSGQKAGGILSDGRHYIKIDGKPWKLHRIIFLYHHGYIPKYIDHIDGNPGNNRIENLREVTLSENQWNRKQSKNNKTGSKGVCNHKNKFRAYCMVNNKNHHLGYFDTQEEAESEVKKFREKHHNEFHRHI